MIHEDTYLGSRIDAVKNQLWLEDFNNRLIQELIVDLQQKWIHGEGNVTDQYGFAIYINNNYKLFYKDEHVATFYSYEAAKLVSRVMLNDIIANRNVIRMHPTNAVGPLFFNADKLDPILKPALTKSEIPY